MAIASMDWALPTSQVRSLIGAEAIDKYLKDIEEHA